VFDITLGGGTAQKIGIKGTSWELPSESGALLSLIRSTALEIANQPGRQTNPLFFHFFSYSPSGGRRAKKEKGEKRKGLLLGGHL